MEVITIQSVLLFQFDTFSSWVNHASSWFKPYRHLSYVCLDKNNNVCHIGKDFMYSRDNNLFPVRVYKLIQSSEVL